MATKKKGAYNYLVPFDSRGLQHYPEAHRDYSNVKYVHSCIENGLADCSGAAFHYRRTEGEVIVTQPDWRQNDPFYAKSQRQVHLVGGRSGGSLSHVRRRLDGVVQEREVIRGIALGQWRVRKRGANYGVIAWNE